MIYVNGCSLTYGMELGTSGYKLHAPQLTSSENDYRQSHSWPGLLGTYYCEDVVNHGASGGSNARIFNTTVEALEKMEVPPSLVVIGWTSLGRIEIFDRDTNSEYQCSLRTAGLAMLKKHNVLPPNVVKYADAYVDHFLDYDWLASKLSVMVIALSAYLRDKKIPFIMFSAIPNKMESRQFDNYLPVDMYSATEKLPAGPYLHTLEEGHALWAKTLIAEIDKRRILEPLA